MTQKFNLHPTDKNVVKFLKILAKSGDIYQALSDILGSSGRNLIILLV